MNNNITPSFHDNINNITTFNAAATQNINNTKYLRNNLVYQNTPLLSNTGMPSSLLAIRCHGYAIKEAPYCYITKKKRYQRATAGLAKVSCCWL